MKIVLNKCYGGFSLSDEAHKRLGSTWKTYPGSYSGGHWELPAEFGDIYSSDISFRTSEKLIAVVEELGAEANGTFAQLEVIHLPNDVADIYIDEYDGIESVCEGRRW